MNYEELQELLFTSELNLRLTYTEVLEYPRHILMARLKQYSKYMKDENKKYDEEIKKGRLR